MTSGPMVAVYNKFVPWPNAAGQMQYFAVESTEITNATVPAGSGQTLIQLYHSSGTGIDGTQLLGEGLYALRSPSGMWTFVEVPQLFSTPNGGLRDAIASPWQSECQNVSVIPNGGCALYVTNTSSDTVLGSDLA